MTRSKWLLRAARSGSLLLLTVSAGCSPAEDGRVATEAAWGPTPHLAEELRIGVLDGDPSYTFSDVSSLMVREDGTILVADDADQIRMYNPVGEFAGTIGHSGQGPGEYTTVTALAEMDDGRIALLDGNMTRRLTFFSSTGDVLEVASLEIPEDWAQGVWDLIRAVDGGFYISGARIQGAPVPDGTTVQHGEVGYLKLSEGGQVIDSRLTGISVESLDVPNFYIATPGGIQEAFVQTPIFAITPRGTVITGNTGRYELDLKHSDGSASRIVRTYDPVPLGDEERREWQARADHYTRNNPNGSSAGLQMPVVKPPIRAIEVDGEGRIWVKRYAPAVRRDVVGTPRPGAPPRITWIDPTVYDVFQEDGTFLGTLQMPLTSKLFYRRGNHLWGTILGELDEPYIVRYRIMSG